MTIKNRAFAPTPRITAIFDPDRRVYVAGVNTLPDDVHVSGVEAADRDSFQAAVSERLSVQDYVEACRIQYLN